MGDLKVLWCTLFQLWENLRRKRPEINYYSWPFFKVFWELWLTKSILMNFIADPLHSILRKIVIKESLNKTYCWPFRLVFWEKCVVKTFLKEAYYWSLSILFLRKKVLKYTTWSFCIVFWNQMVVKKCLN